MNKKGFTLIELLAVLIILATIIALVFPAVSNVINKSKNTVKDIQMNKVLDAAYDYTLKNSSFLPEKGETKYITLNELKKENLINSDIKDSTSQNSLTEDLVISIKNTGTNKKKTNNYSKYNGNYLYTIEVEFMNTDEFKTNRPTINFDGYDTNPIVINLNMGDKYTDLEYTAASNDGKDLTSNVVKNIIYNNTNSKEVDSSVAGIYHINYSVIDSNGYSNYATVNVIVLDEEKPVLVIPDNVSITSDVTSYDLMEGVSCTDNSGVCDIKVDENIKYEVSGKYIVEYIGTDPSGNTTILKRVITIE